DQVTPGDLRVLSATVRIPMSYWRCLAMRHVRSIALLFLVAPFPVLLSGCYAGLAGAIVGLVSATSGNGGAGTVAPILTDLALPENKPSPAEITFKIQGSPSGKVNADILYRLGSSEETHPIRLVEGETLHGLSPQEEPYVRHWEFARQLQNRDGLTEQVTLFASISMKPGSSVVLEGQSVGNDPPEIQLPIEIRAGPGFVKATLMVKASSADLVSIAAEYSLVGEGADASWLRATSLGAPLTRIQVEKTWTQRVFLWEVTTDIGKKDR